MYSAVIKQQTGDKQSPLSKPRSGGREVANKEVSFLCTKLDDAKSWERNGGSQAITTVKAVSLVWRGQKNGTW